jgi:hypothetical protein
MPYIKQNRRDEILIKKASPSGWRKHLVLDEIKNAGEINYAVTELILHFFRVNSSKNYQAVNDIIGALEGAKAEFQRRTVADYEDDKIKENGDVY